MVRTRPSPPPAPRQKAEKGARVVEIEGRTLPISPVLDTLFLWMTERHSIHQKRMAGAPQPWTEDRIFQQHAFTNVFRIYDRMTQYILRHVIQEGDPDVHETCFRVILFRFFCRISTWELLKDHFGEITWKDYDIGQYEAVLREEYDSGSPLYGTAYIMPAPALGAASNFANHLRLLKVMMDADLPGQLVRLKELSDAYERISLFPSMGNFLAFQLLLDLNMIPQLSYPEDWAMCGPGAEACLRKIFGPGVNRMCGDALKWLHDTQARHFARLGIAAARRPRLYPGGSTVLSLVDLEHSLCECEVYSREMHPTIRDKRTQISSRRKFKPSEEPLTNDLPKKWKAVSQAVKARSRTQKPLPPVDASAPDPAWILSHIVKEAPGANGKPLYLVRYAGYGPTDDLWQDEDDLEGAQELLAEWRQLTAKIAASVADLKLHGAKSQRRVSRRSSARFS